MARAAICAKIGKCGRAYLDRRQFNTDISFLGTGASISVAQEELVSKGMFGKGKLTLLDASGGRKERVVAQVMLTVGTKTFVLHVAVAPNYDLCGKGTFAVNLEDESAFAVWQEFRESTKQIPVNVVRISYIITIHDRCFT